MLDRLPPHSRLAGFSEGDVELRTARGAVFAAAVGVDLSDPLPRSVFRSVTGRPPTHAGEIAVTEHLARRGFPPGTHVELLAGGRPLHIVGTVRGPDELAELAVVGRVEDLGLDGAARRWLVESPRGVGWDSVRRLNDRGLGVLSRAVADHPPVPLTGRRSGRPEGDGLPDVFVSIPWELLATLVIGVPLLAAAGVALLTSAKLPLTYRRT